MSVRDLFISESWSLNDVLNKEIIKFPWILCKDLLWFIIFLKTRPFHGTWSQIEIKYKIFLFLRAFFKETLKRLRSSRQEVFCEKGVVRNFTKFPGKQLCQSYAYGFSGFYRNSGFSEKSFENFYCWDSCKNNVKVRGLW